MKEIEFVLKGAATIIAWVLIALAGYAFFFAGNKEEAIFLLLIAILIRQ